MARRQTPRNPLKFSRKSRRRPHLLHRRRKYKNILGRYYKRKTKRHGRRVNRKRLPSGAAFARVIARKVKNRKRRLKQKIYLHYGDLNHMPMQTRRFSGTAAELRALINEARDDGWPLRVERTE